MSRYPWLILAAIMLVAAGTLALSGCLQAVAVNDTPGYAEFPFNSWSAGLGQTRTPGYPLLLALVRGLTEGYALVPTVHLALYCGGVALFHAGLLAHGCSRLTSPWIAGSLLAANIVPRYIGTLATDTMAAALGIGCCGALMLWTAVGERRRRWAAVVAALTFAAWFVRPSMLSLAPWVCIVGPLAWLKLRGNAASVRALARVFLVCGLITLTPILAWCVLRAVVVGKFGVVSFGGYNLVGVAGQFLDDELVAQLPAGSQLLARAGLARRDQLPVDVLHWPDNPVLNYMRMEENYDVTIWMVFVPAAHDLYGQDARVVNTQLKELAVETIRLRPTWYGVWLAKAARQAMRISCEEFVSNLVTGGMTILTVLVSALCIVKKWRRPEAPPNPSDPTGIVSLLFLLAFSYAGLNLALVIVVCPPLGRMADAACVLFPALITAVLVNRIRYLWNAAT